MNCDGLTAEDKPPPQTHKALYLEHLARLFLLLLPAVLDQLFQVDLAALLHL